MEILSLYPQAFASNCYIIHDNGHAVVIDPSISAEAIISAAADASLTLDAILLTHGHFDHILSLDILRERLSIPAYIHENDAELLGDGKKNAFALFFGKDRKFKPAEKTFKDSDTIKIGSSELKVINTPGHTAGSSCFLSDNFIVTGDTLFADSYGRCDLYSGDIFEMKRSLEKLRSLDIDKNMNIYSGHGRSTTLSRALDNSLYL